MGARRRFVQPTNPLPGRRKMVFADATVLTNKGAAMVVAAGEAEAQKLGLKMTIAVCDAGGHLVSLSRMDGAFAVSAELAAGKAKSAVLFARETKLLEGGSNVKDGSARTALISSGHLLMEGGVPIMHNGKIVAAVG